MPKRKYTKKPRTTKKKASKSSKKPVTKKKATTKKDTTELLPEQRAQMWVMREEGASLSDIATEVGCHARTVSREFEKDPARHAGLVAVQSETRAARWKQIENKSLEVLNHAIEDVACLLRTPKGLKRQKFTANQIQKADVLRKLIGPLRMAADSATNKSQLLTGGPTQIMGGSIEGGGIGVDAGNMTDDEVIRLAIAQGITEELPQALKEKLARMDGVDVGSKDLGG